MKSSLRMRISLLFVLLWVISAVSTVRAQVRKYSNEFLNIGAGARGLGMGGAQGASVNDATAGYWNPAGLLGVQGIPQFSLMHAEYFAGIGKYDFATAAIPLPDKKRVIGFTLLRFAVDDIPNTLNLIGPDGTVNYNNVTTFSSADYAFLFSYAQPLNIRTGPGKLLPIRIGANIKVIHRIIGSFARAWGFGIDAGAQLELKKWRFGLLARDITSTFNSWQFSFTDQQKQILYLTQNDIPVHATEITLPTLIPGVAYKFNLKNHFCLLTEVGVNVAFDGRRSTIWSGKRVSLDPHFGLEASYKNIIFLRAGISNIQRMMDDTDTSNQRRVTIYQPSIGAGFRVHLIHIEYAFTNLANPSQPLYTHIFSILFSLGKWEKGKNK
ncbi:MAG: putative type IX sorting system protein PorV2 [Chitinophagaceae bacterium]